MAIDSNKSFEVQEHGITIDSGTGIWIGGGDAVPTNNAPEGSRYFRTSPEEMYVQEGPGVSNNWVLFVGGGGLESKSGTVAGASFTSVSGEQVYDVVFSTAFADTNYSVTVLSTAQRIWHYTNKTTTGFRINSQSNSALTGETIDWQAIKNGES